MFYNEVKLFSKCPCYIALKNPYSNEIQCTTMMVQAKIPLRIT